MVRPHFKNQRPNTDRFSFYRFILCEIKQGFYSKGQWVTLFVSGEIFPTLCSDPGLHVDFTGVSPWTFLFLPFCRWSCHLILHLLPTSNVNYSSVYPYFKPELEWFKEPHSKYTALKKNTQNQNTQQHKNRLITTLKRMQFIRPVSMAFCNFKNYSRYRRYSSLKCEFF